MKINNTLLIFVLLFSTNLFGQEKNKQMVRLAKFCVVTQSSGKPQLDIGLLYEPWTTDHLWELRRKPKRYERNACIFRQT